MYILRQLVRSLSPYAFLAHKSDCLPNQWSQVVLYSLAEDLAARQNRSWQLHWLC